jgi:hypothetical protein
MSGKGPARIPAPRRPGPRDAAFTRPWFAPSRLGGRPWLLTFVGTDHSFVDAFFEGVARSGAGFDEAAFPKLLPLRDLAEPPRALLDGGGAPSYARFHVEPTSTERPGAVELELDGKATLEEALADAGIDVAAALPPPSDAAQAAWLRKLYLPMHCHFHLVACELVCDRPGAPRIDTKRVVKAGMVVRRFIADAASSRPRWEDWIPSPHGGGIWIEIADDAMKTIHGIARALDPEALQADVFGAGQPEAYGLLGVGADLEIALRLSTYALAALPATPALVEVKKHTARYGFLPITASEKERELPDTTEDPLAIAQAFAKVAEEHLQARVVDHADAIRARIGAALLPLLVRFRATLPDAPKAADVAAARDAVASSAGVSNAEVDDAAKKIGLAALAPYAELFVDFPDAQARWNHAMKMVAQLVNPPPPDPNAPPDVPLKTAPSLPQWAKDIFAAQQTNFSVLAQDALLATFEVVLPPPQTSFADDVDRGILTALLLWIRRHRHQLLFAPGAFYDKVFTELLNIPKPNPDDYTLDPKNLLIVLKAPGTVGAMGDEVEAWLSADAARAVDPVPWKSPILSAEDLEVHKLARPLESALSDVDAQGAGAGGAYADLLDQRARVVFKDLHDAIGGKPLNLLGLSPSAQPERGLLVFPGPSPTASSLATFKDDVQNRYLTDASARPDDVRAQGKARRQVVRARYDSDHLYAVWCFAKVAGRDPCEEPQLVWSKRTDVFSIAEPMDLLGLKPVAIQLPDLTKLVRDIPRMKKARALPFAAITTPQNSGIITGDDAKDTAREWGIAWICSFGIPIFTICAWIIFKLIFSIMIVIPGFAWMLLLKFCIPVPAPKKS